MPGVTISDGSVSFGGGVNSVKVTTIASAQLPDGLARNELAWLINGAVRDGGISPRAGNTYLGTAHDGSALFQGGFMYDPPANTVASGGNSGGAAYVDGNGQPVATRGTLIATKAAGSPFIFPATGASVNITFTAPYTGSIGDQITLYNNLSPWGIYTVTNIAGAVVTLQRTSVGPSTGYNLTSLVLIAFVPATPVTVPVPPPIGDDPYLIVLIGGIVYRIELVTFSVTNLSAIFGLTMPATVETAFFCQAEEFLIIQIFDGITLPLFWDGLTMRRSRGITNTAVAPGTPGVNEIPSAGPMDYFMGRLWYARGRQYSAGDIVGGASGTIQYNFRDAVLNVTENPLVLGGDGFTVPENGGNIRALRHNANLDAALGQGRLFIFTISAVYNLEVPVTRADWIAADDANQPKQTVVQLANGSVGDRCIVAANGDLFYASLEPGIRSMITAVKDFGKWGNVQISAQVQRVLQFCDRSLMHAMSGINFDNRLLMTSLPRQTPQGIVGQVIIAMDFTPISGFGTDVPAVWEGMRDGLDHLQLFYGNFGGRQRGFSLAVSRDLSTIDLWELTTAGRFDVHPRIVNGARTVEIVETRVTTIMELPSFTWGQEFLLKKMVSAELWVDRVFGEVIFKLEWRPDSDSCWYFWHEWKICSARNCTEDVYQPCGYPILENGSSYRQTMTLPLPPDQTCALVMGRPANIGYQMQPKLTTKGSVRVRGFILHGEKWERKLYSNLPS